MSWHNLQEKVNTLEADTVYDVYEDIQYIRETAVNLGISVRAIQAVSVGTDSTITQIKSILQLVESGLTILCEDITESIYYEQHKTIGDFFALGDYMRWYLILTDLYDIIVNGKGVWRQVYLTLEQGQPDMQIHGNDVYIRGDSIV